MTTHFPQRIKTAAATFKYSATAFVHISQGDSIKVCLQAPEIGSQFAGPVDFGKDPKGILSYDVATDLQSGRADYNVSYYDELAYDFDARWITFKVDFFKPDAKQPFASFLARVDTKDLPDSLLPPSNQRGTGRWSRFRVATSQTDIVGRDINGIFLVVLRSGPVTKVAGILAEDGTPFKTSGILIFFDERNLVNRPRTVADHTKDRIVFRVQKTSDVVAVLLPTSEMTFEPANGDPVIWRQPRPRPRFGFGFGFGQGFASGVGHVIHGGFSVDGENEASMIGGDGASLIAQIEEDEASLIEEEETNSLIDELKSAKSE